MKETNKPIDLGSQWVKVFLLLLMQNERVYTRDGQFYIDSQGIMVNSMGHEFSDEGGNPITLVPGQPDLIDKEGQIFKENKILVNWVYLSSMTLF